MGPRQRLALLGSVVALLVPLTGAAAVVAEPARPAPATPKVVLIAAGLAHSLVIGADGRVYGAGSNDLAQLTGTQRRKLGLILLSGLPAGVRATAVSGGMGNSLVVGDDGQAYGAGLNQTGQLTGTQDWWHRLHPLQGLPTGVRAVAVASASYHNLVLGDDGVAYGTGDNWSGQLTGGPANHVRTLIPLTGLPAGVTGEAIAGGNAFSLVLGDDGVAYGAGNNAVGQLTGSEPYVRTLTPLAGLPAGVEATAIAASGTQSVVLGSDGVAYGAGHNQVGQLTGTDDPRLALGPLTGLPDGVRAVAIAAGRRHTLVLGDDGLVYGTGSNSDGQLTHRREFRLTLTPLERLWTGAAPVAIAAGHRHSLVLGSDGRVYGAGANGLGQITGDISGGMNSFIVMEWGFANLERPTIAGTTSVGQRLTVHPGRWWPAAASYRYRWYRHGVPIPGATSKSRVLVAADLGARIKVRVTAEGADHRPASRFTAPVGPVRRP